jgi:hypothetical protein
MSSIITICNRALQKVGAHTITSLTDQSVNARALNTMYYSVRDSVMAASRWNFTIQRFQLAASSNQNAFGPLNIFPLPAGWLRVLPPDPLDNVNDRDWLIEGSNIISAWNPPLNVKIQMKIEDVTLYPASFIEALAAKLAYELCEPLTQSNTKKQACDADYKMAIADAKKLNAIQNVPQISVEDPYITTRVSGSRGWFG